jgi:hypothetical protein
VSAGTGLGLLAAGVACGVLAKQDSDALTHASQTGGVYSSATATAGARDQVLEGVLLGLGGAAVVTGAVLYGLGVRRSHDWSLRASLAPSGAAIALAGAF